MAGTSATGINPLLIQVLKREVLEQTSPTISMLDGEYVGMVAKNKARVSQVLPSNIQSLKCRNCGKKGKYDLGVIYFNLDKYGRSRKGTQKTEDNLEMEDYVQTTGYFRCKHCNSAGNWEFSSNFLFQMTAKLMMRTFMQEEGDFQFGEIRLFDGSAPRWATDSEEHLLKKIQNEGQSGLLWNKLGNTYYKGGRPELAAAALEQSIRVDPTHMESHFTLGQILFQIGENDLASYHYLQALSHAKDYSFLDAHSLRDILANTLSSLLYMDIDSDGDSQFMSTLEEIAATGVDHERHHEFAQLALVEMELFPDRLESFYPLAELYMGDRKKQLPSQDRTLDKLLKPRPIVKPKKKKRKRK